VDDFKVRLALGRDRHPGQLLLDLADPLLPFLRDRPLNFVELALLGSEVGYLVQQEPALLRHPQETGTLLVGNQIVANGLLDQLPGLVELPAKG
jgi:hypothetical protein